MLKRKKSGKTDAKDQKQPLPKRRCQQKEVEVNEGPKELEKPEEKKVFELNSGYRYTGQDINLCLDAMVQGIGGYASGCRFLLKQQFQGNRNISEKSTYSEEINYHVALTPAVYVTDTATIDYYLNKNKDKQEDDGEAKAASDSKTDSLKPEAIQKDALDEILPKLMQAAKPKRGRKRVNQQIEDGKQAAKILFPYSEEGQNWKTIEIQIHRENHEYCIYIWIHDPRGDASLKKENFDVLFELIQNRIKELDEGASFKDVTNISPPTYPRRQHPHDKNSSGIFVVKDIFNLITGAQFRKRPYSLKQVKALRQQQVEEISKYFGEDDPRTLSFIERQRQSADSQTDSALSIPEQEKLNANNALDQLAWLLETNPASPTAVCIVNNTLLVSANNIDHSTGETTKQVEHIDDLLNYFIARVAGKATSEQRKSILRQMCLQKLEGESYGMIKTLLNPQELYLLLNTLINDDRWEAIIPMDIIKRIPHSKEIVAQGVQFVQDTMRRFERLERFLASNPEAEHLRNTLDVTGTEARRFIHFSPYGAANYSDRSWILNREKKGYVILAINRGSVHAELKLIDYLLASRILSEDDKTSYYIGVSIPCCSGCYRVINLINQVLKAEIIKVAGTHGQAFDDNWLKNRPVFLLLLDKLLDRTYEKGLYLCEHHKSEGHLEAYDQDGNLIESYYPLKSLDSCDEECAALLEENEDIERIKIYLYRDYTLVKELREQFEYLRKQKQIHIYHDQEKHYMEHISPADSPNIQEGWEVIGKRSIEDEIGDINEKIEDLKRLLITKQVAPDEILTHCQMIKLSLSELEHLAQKMKDNEDKIDNKLSEEEWQKIYNSIANSNEPTVNLSSYPLQKLTEEQWQDFTEALRLSNIIKLIIPNNVSKEIKGHLYLIIEENIKRFQLTRNHTGLKDRIARLFWQNLDYGYNQDTGTINGKLLESKELKQIIEAQKNMGLIISND